MNINEKSTSRLRPQNSSSSLPLEKKRDTASQSKTLSRNAATERLRSARVRSIQRCKNLRQKSLSSPGPDRRLAHNDAIESADTLASVKPERTSWQTFSPFKRNCSLGISSCCLTFVTTRLVVEPVAYLFLPLDYADSFLGDLCEKRLRMWNSRYRTWVICVFDLLWAADLCYQSIATRIKMLWS